MVSYRFIVCEAVLVIARWASMIFETCDADSLAIVAVYFWLSSWIAVRDLISREIPTAAILNILNVTIITVSLTLIFIRFSIVF
jgi:hypothetical protein